MIVEMQEYVAERGELLRGQVRKLRETSVESVREAITGSAETRRVDLEEHAALPAHPDLCTLAGIVRLHRRQGYQRAARAHPAYG